MKRKVFSLLLSVALLFAAMPMQVFASSGSGSMQVSYTYSSEYTVNIPASISLNDGDVFTFSAENVSLGAGKQLVIILDSDTYENAGNFYLYKEGGAEFQRISCTIERGSVGGGSWEDITGLADHVAVFSDGATTPSQYGALRFTPQLESGTEYGTYTGTVRFIIDISDF